MSLELVFYHSRSYESQPKKRKKISLLSSLSKTSHYAHIWSFLLAKIVPCSIFTYHRVWQVLFFLFVSSLHCHSNLTRGVGRFREILRAVENRTTQSLRMVRDGLCCEAGFFFYLGLSLGDVYASPQAFPLVYLNALHVRVWRIIQQ